MKARSIIMLVAGILLSMAGVGLLFGGIATTWINSRQNDGGYLTSPKERFAVDSRAIVSTGTEEIRDDAVPGPLPFDVGSIRIRAESASPGKDIFVGIASKTDVDSYLAGSNYSELRDVRFRPFTVEYREVQGATQPAGPEEQGFWAASASGSGERELDWNIEPGNWSVVVMNSDASPDVAADLQAGFRSELFGPIAAGLLATGAIMLVLGVPLLVFGAHGLGRHTPAPPAAPTPPAGPAPLAGSVPEAGSAPIPVPAMPGPYSRPTVRAPYAAWEVAPYPVRLRGEPDPMVSRWMWLVKWLLAIPHFIVLVFLWFAFVIVTVIAGFSILFTGRYPRSLFQFNVGVLRWNWRVAFYAYAALGTDRYPPFTLARTDYPADFEVEYPERLSRGLVLVKWWLLAIPHLLVIAALTGSNTVRWSDPANPGIRYETGAGLSLLGVLVLIAAVILLFTGRHQRRLFDLIIGINRWVYRVITYVALMRDDYPPFRLDQGSAEVQEGQPDSGPTGPG
jgi:hypothetical protein